MDKSSPSEIDEEITITGLLKSETEPLYLLRPSPEIIVRVIEVANQNEDTPLIHVLAAEDDLQAVRRTFSIATHTADLVEKGDLTLTPTTPAGRGTLIVSEDTLYSVVTVDEEQFVFASTNLSDTLLELCNNYQGTQHFDLRTPGWTRILESLEETFSAEIRDDFSKAIKMSSKSDRELNIDEATIALLVASKNELLLYDISRWGEDIRLCSPATFSRTKSTLEDYGIIETERVPINVGRPRLRLMLAEEYTSISFPRLLQEVSTAIPE